MVQKTVAGPRGSELVSPVGLRDPRILEALPDDIKGYLGTRREELTFGHFVERLFSVQREIAATLDAKNEAGVLLKTRFHTKARELVPSPRGMKFVPVSEEERALHSDRMLSRSAANCMGAPVSLEMWHTQGDGGDAFSGGKGRMPPSAKLDAEHLPMMASIFGYTGVAFHTWLDVHPEDLRALSLNLAVRDLKINSAFHGAFHGPIFARGAMSSEFREVRHLAKYFKQEGQLISMLGWDPATAIEEKLKGSLGQAKIDELRSSGAVYSALETAREVGGKLDVALVRALMQHGVTNARDVVGKVLGEVVDRSACAEVCDWDGTDGKMLLEAHSKPASLLGLGKAELAFLSLITEKPAADLERGITRMDLLVMEKVERIMMTGGLGVIKIEPKFEDPSKMTEADIEAVIEIRNRVVKGIKNVIGAQIMAQIPKIYKRDYEAELERRSKIYEGCITCQIEEGHSRQMPGRLASADVEIGLHEKALARAYHENWSQNATFLGDPDFTVLVNPDSIRRHYVLLKAGLIGPESNPKDRITTEFDMAPHFWDTVYGFQASRNAVNTSIAIARNVLRVERMMQATGMLTDSEREVQKVCGTLPKDQGIYQMTDTSRIFQALAYAYSLPLEGLEQIPAAEDSKKFRALIGRPYDIARPTAEIAEMARGELAALKVIDAVK